VSAGPCGARLGHDPVLGFDRSHALAEYVGIRPWRVILTGAVYVAAEGGSPRRYPASAIDEGKPGRWDTTIGKRPIPARASGLCS
jgi:hypothetical protein